MPDDEYRVRSDEPTDDECPGQRRDANRGQGLQRIGADNQLEGVEGSGQRGIEGRCDRAGGAATDEGADVVAAKAEPSAEPRRERGPELRLGRLEPYRSAKPAREQCHADQAQAVADRHPTAEQRVRLDRIDNLALAPVPQQRSGEADEQAPEHRHQQYPAWPEVDIAQLPLLGHREGKPP